MSFLFWDPCSSCRNSSPFVFLFCHWVYTVVNSEFSWWQCLDEQCSFLLFSLQSLVPAVMQPFQADATGLGSYDVDSEGWGMGQTAMWCLAGRRFPAKFAQCSGLELDLIWSAAGTAEKGIPDGSPLWGETSPWGRTTADQETCSELLPWLTTIPLLHLSMIFLGLGWKKSFTSFKWFALRLENLQRGGAVKCEYLCAEKWAPLRHQVSD